MVKYLKTKNSKKKRISQKKNNKKNKIRKNKTRKNKTRKMIGGLLSEIEGLDISQKTIILVGEFHTHKRDVVQYNKIVRKQLDIIDKTIQKFGVDKTYIYSEAPKESERMILTTDDYHPSVIIQRATIPVKLSSITSCDRQGSSCNNEYADDILSIFTEPRIDCVIAILGLLHIPEIGKIIHEKRPDIKIVVVNTVSVEQLMPLIPEIIRNNYSDVLNLIQIEKPYELPELQELPELSYVVNVLLNDYGDKIYQCPICGSKSGSLAPENPRDLSLFHHYRDCPNKGKIPVEN